MLRVLRAATLSFLALSLISMAMYIVFVQILGVNQVRYAAGGLRDVILRIYAMAFALLLIAVELDFTAIMQKFAVFKGFLPRACVFFLVSQLCAPRPIAKDLAQQAQQNQYYVYSNDDDNSGAYSDYQAPPIPTSVIGFQRVTSFLLCVSWPTFMKVEIILTFLLQSQLFIGVPCLWPAVFRSIYCQGIFITQRPSNHNGDSTSSGTNNTSQRSL